MCHQRHVQGHLHLRVPKKHQSSIQEKILFHFNTLEISESSRRGNKALEAIYKAIRRKNVGEGEGPDAEEGFHRKASKMLNEQKLLGKC